MAATTSIHTDKRALMARLQPFGQAHLVAFWDQLSAVQQQNLAQQIDAIDLGLFQRLQAEHQKIGVASPGSHTYWSRLAARAEPPPAMRLGGRGVGFTPAEARAAGAAALSSGQIGMIVVAGGLGTRLGFNHPKGLLPIGPLSGRTLFQILIDQLLAIRRHYQVALPLYVMTSPATDAVTRRFLAEHQNFGLPAEDVTVFCQATMWAVDAQFERILLASPDSLFLGPDGHGGMVSALSRSGGLADMERRGLKHLFYGQIDNPLTQVCDELLIGGHILAGSEITTQVIQKQSALERVGNVVSIDGRVQVIEYSDLPEDYARQTNPDGSLKLWAGNLAVHVFKVDFLRRSALQPHALPYHCARKKVACLDAFGQRIEPRIPNALRFERFIFDLLPLARQALVVEVDPAAGFAPVKNSDNEPTDNPRLAKAAMASLHRAWLGQAGVEVAAGLPVEIHPLWARNVPEIRQRLAPGTFFGQATYFSPDGPRTIV